MFLRYVDNFISLSGRDYGQVLFQSVKSLFYLSPLIPIGILLGWRHRKDLLVWYLFLLVNVAFYYVVFDFTHRTFDRYLLFIVLPGAVIAGVAYTRLLRTTSPRVFGAAFGIITLVLGGITAFLLTLPHRVIPLIPKSAYIEAITSGKWNFLLPLTGGSGPLGFYVPVDVLLFLWGIAGVGLVLLFVSRTRVLALVLILSASFVHSALVTTEYLTGHFYGSSSTVVHTLMEAVDTLPAGVTVLTYNDIGAYELYGRGRYAGRFYPHPSFVEGNVERLSHHTGRYLVVNIPELNPDSVYGRYFSTCKVEAFAENGKITGSLLDCTGQTLGD